MNAGPMNPSPWVLAGEPTSLGDPVGLVTLVDGQTFCLSGRSGDFSNNPTHGVFFADMRVLSKARLLVGGVDRRAAGGQLGDASSATFVGTLGRGRVNPKHGCSSCAAVNSAPSGTSRSSCATPAASSVTAVVELEVAADFADVFAVKEGRSEQRGRALARGATSTACSSAGDSATCIGRQN